MISKLILGFALVVSQLPVFDPPKTITPTVATSTDTQVPYRAQTARLIDLYRVNNNFKVLQANQVLNAVAQAHAVDMATYNYFNHKDRYGRWAQDRVALSGYKAKLVGEIIAWGQTTPEQVFNDWLNSPGHKAAIVTPGYNEFGVGCVAGQGGRLFWVVVFTTKQ